MAPQLQNWLRFILATLALASPTCQAAKLLLMPALHYSHVNLFSVNGKALLDAGHDVTVLTSPRFKDVVVQHGLKPVINAISEEADFTRVFESNSTDVFAQQSFFRTLNQLKPAFQKLCQETNDNTLLMTFLSDQKFDLIMIDGMALRHCMYTVPFRLSVPYVLFTTLPDPWSSGVPSLPSFEPSVLQSASNEMSILERLKTATNYLVLYSGFLSAGLDEITSPKFPGKRLPSLRELHHRAEMVLVNVETLCVDYPRVSLPHYQYVGGGLSPSTKKHKLDSSLSEWMGWAPHGVIVVSLGSRPGVQQVWDVLGDKLEDALSRLHKWRAVVQRDVTKRQSTRPLPENIRYLPWLPQETLLAHPRTRLFVTHGGNNGQVEAIFHAVPMLTLPITGDQFYNGVRAAKRGYGLHLDLRSSTADDLHAAILDLISNATYLKNVRKCSDILRSQPSATEKVVMWIEHVLMFGGAHLRPPTLDMPLHRMFMLDVLFILCIMIAGIITLLFFCVRKVIHSCRNLLKERKSKAE